MTEEQKEKYFADLAKRRRPCRVCNQQNPSHDPMEPICRSLRKRQKARNAAVCARWAAEGHYDRLWNERIST